MQRVSRGFHPSNLIAPLLLLLLTPFASAAIFEFNPVQPVQGIPAPFNVLPQVQIKDGVGGANALPGLDTINTLNFTVTGVNTPITRVEVLISKSSATAVRVALLLAVTRSRKSDRAAPVPRGKTPMLGA